MRPGTIFRKFQARDGQEVTLRAPQWSDLDDMLEFINSLVDERAPILKDTKMTREGEVDWLARLLSKIEKDQIVAVAAEVDGRFVGQSEVAPKYGRSRHVGVLGISLRDSYGDIGIGTELMREVEHQALNLGIEIITLDAFSSNARALHLYKKMGYHEVGRVPRGNMMNGEYFDDVIMVKEVVPNTPLG
jgi:RimJ/RimL family protein N-acetyltransferase